MKGLYVYGALLMLMCFVIGIWLNSHLLTACSLVACAMAAAGEALIEVQKFRVEMPAGMINAVALGSWIMAVAALVSALLELA